MAIFSYIVTAKPHPSLTCVCLLSVVIYRYGSLWHLIRLALSRKKKWCHSKIKYLIFKLSKCKIKAETLKGCGELSFYFARPDD